MSLTEDLIRERIAADATDPQAAALAAGLIHDKLVAAGGRDLAAVEAAITAGRAEFAPLFKAPQPAKPEPVKPKRDITTAAGRRDAASDAAYEKATSDGNPFKKRHWNLTHQTMIAKKDPELARRMKEAAGGK